MTTLPSTDRLNSLIRGTLHLLFIETTLGANHARSAAFLLAMTPSIRPSFLRSE
jgi:hypothetical protein